MNKLLCIFFFFCIGVQLICNVALALGLQQSESVVYTYIYSFFPHINYYKTLNRPPYAVQYIPVRYPLIVCLAHQSVCSVRTGNFVLLVFLPTMPRRVLRYSRYSIHVHCCSVHEGTHWSSFLRYRVTSSTGVHLCLITCEGFIMMVFVLGGMFDKI